MAGKVLIVDDSPLICKALARDFRRAGFKSVATHSGWDAVELVGQNRFDVAVVDLAMPAMPGDILVERLQEHAPHLPCIVLTGNASKQQVLYLTEKPNVIAVLYKPWDYDNLVTVVESARARRDDQQAHAPVSSPVARVLVVDDSQLVRMIHNNQ